MPVIIVGTKIVSKLLGLVWICIDLHRADGTRLFSEVHGDGTKGNEQQLQYGKVLVRCQETFIYLFIYLP